MAIRIANTPSKKIRVPSKRGKILPGCACQTVSKEEKALLEEFMKRPRKKKKAKRRRRVAR